MYQTKATYSISASAYKMLWLGTSWANHINGKVFKLELKDGLENKIEE